MEFLAENVSWKRDCATGVLLLAGGGVVFASRGKAKGKPPEPPPFRLGHLQAEDLQVRVPEVGVVDTETHVAGKSVGSATALSHQRRDGPAVTPCPAPPPP